MRAGSTVSISVVLRVLSGTARERQAAPGGGKILLRMGQADSLKETL